MFSVLKKLLVTSLVASGGASGVVVEVARDNLMSGSVTPSDALLSSAEGTEEKEDSSSFEEVSTQEPTTMQQESDDSALVVKGEDPNVGTNSEDEKEKNDVPAKELTNRKEAGEKVVK